MKYKTERFDTLASTNDYAKQKRAEKENLIVIAKAQTGGRGTKGRSFSSAEGGLYLSVLTFYENFPASRAFEIMQNAAAAVCETLALCGLRPVIKWPNDIFVNGKKICGILIENSFSGSLLSSSVVGIGLNVNNRLEKALSSIATSVWEQTGKTVETARIERTLLDFFQKGVAEKYASYLGFIGEEVTLIVGEKQEKAALLGVDEAGNLLAETKDGTRRFAAAEVSVRTGVEE